MSLLYLRISRTMSKKALSTLMRLFAEVSMNLQPKERASALPSVSPSFCQHTANSCSRNLREASICWCETF